MNFSTSPLKTTGGMRKCLWALVLAGFVMHASAVSATAGAAKTIIIRSDDAEAYFSVDLLQYITDTLITNNIPQTIAVIPDNSYDEALGDDPDIVAYLNAIKVNPSVELALHGYQHTTNEFSKLTLPEADAKIVAGLALMNQAIGVTPTTFIPPEDAFNSNTLTACKNNGFTCFSSATFADPHMKMEVPVGLLHVPAMVDFQDWANGGQLKSSAAIIQEAQSNLNTYDIAVIQIHFWSFGDGNGNLVPAGYQTLLDVIGWVHQMASGGVKLMTLRQYTTASGNGITPVISNVSASQAITYGTATITLTGTVSAAGPVYPADGETAFITINGISTNAVIAGGTGAFSVVFQTAFLPYSATPYTITYAYGGDTNLNTATNASTALTVNKAPLTITARNKSKTYGRPDPTLTVNYAGLTNGDTSAVVSGLTVTRPPGEAVGRYTITPSGASATNYTISYVTGTLTIARAPLTITVDNQSKTYGQSDPILTVTYAGLTNGDTSAVVSGLTVTRAPGETVGNYTITPSGATAASYTIGYVTGALSIAAAPLTITADNQSKTYGQSDPTLTVTYAGFTNSDTSAVVSGLTVTRAPGETVGSYTITPSGATATNYSITEATGTLTITAAPLTITADNQSKKDGQSDPTLTVSYAGLTNGDTSAVVSGLTVTRAPGETVGGYTITPSGAAAANYTIGYVIGLLTIQPVVTANVLSPTNGAVFHATSSIPVLVSATGSYAIASVHILAGTNSLGTVTNVPYEIVWSNVLAGDYVLTAQAWDTHGNMTTSTPVNVGVMSPLWAGAADLGGGWRWLSWFGFFAETGHNWIFHLQHGWMYPIGIDSSSIWFWTPDMNWLWTSDTVYPYLYRSDDNAWLWYLKDSSSPRWLYNFRTLGWESHY